MQEILRGVAMTALITPFTKDGEIDWAGLNLNLQFQIQQGIGGIVPMGTTGESATVSKGEHVAVMDNVFIQVTGGPRRDVFLMAGCGSNSTVEASEYVEAAQTQGYKAVLLVDCYYNGPSSLELRTEYYEAIAKKFSGMLIVPYVIPGRTGCALLPEDLAWLSAKYQNFRGVKEATGDLERMKYTRRLCDAAHQKNFHIISGDDDMTFAMMTDDGVNASGVISVISNVAPVFVQRMCEAINVGRMDEAETIRKALAPLFGLVTVKAPRCVSIPGTAVCSEVTDKFRNPLPIKTMMAGLGMPAGICRQPLGKMSPAGIAIVRKALCQVWEATPWVFHPIEQFYGVDVDKRLNDNMIWAALAY